MQYNLLSILMQDEWAESVPSVGSTILVHKPDMYMVENSYTPKMNMSLNLHKCEDVGCLST